MVTYLGASGDKATPAVQGEYLIGPVGGVGVAGSGLSGSYGVYGSNGTNQLPGAPNGGTTLQGGAGVYGYNCQNPGLQGGAGVYGLNTNGNGVVGETGASNNSGVWGNHTADGNGVSGSSVSGDGVAGTSVTGNGVQGTTGNGNSSGVIGVNTDGGNGVYGMSVSGRAVAGNSQMGNAGHFESGGTGVGVYATSAGGNAGQFQSNTGAGVYASGGIGIYAQGSPAGQFQGDIRVTGDVILVNSPNSMDIAEDFDLEDELLNADPGTVLVIGSGGKLSACAKPYDTRVAGVVSGAGEFRPAVVLGRLDDAGPRSPIALIGKVVCKVDAEFGSIEAGDLLTTSPTLGCAMKVTDRSKALGAILGKALRPHTAGHGMVPILVSMR